MKLTKNQAKAKQHAEAELLIFENYVLSSSKGNRWYSKKYAENKYIYLNENIWWMTIKMRL